MIVGPSYAAQIVRTGYIEDTVDRVSSRGDEELMRTLATAIYHLEEKTTILWLLAKGFNLLCHNKQRRFIAQVVRGFATMPLDEQCKFVMAIGPRVRDARRGWAEAARLQRQRQRGASDHGDSDSEAEDEIQPFVGTIGRVESDALVVELLDAMEASLRRMPADEVIALHRVLERAVDRHITPGALAKLFAKLPDSECNAIQAWLIEEGTLQEETARHLFGHLMSATRFGASAALSAEAFASQIADADMSSAGRAVSDTFWPRWFVGLIDSYEVVEEKCESDKELIKTSVPSRTARARGGPRRPILGRTTERRRPSGCQLHRPLQSFLPSTSCQLSTVLRRNTIDSTVPRVAAHHSTNLGGRPAGFGGGAVVDGEGASRPTLVATEHPTNAVQHPTNPSSGAVADDQDALQPALVATEHARNADERPPALGGDVEVDSQAAPRSTVVATPQSRNSVERPPALGSDVEADSQVAARPTLVANRHSLNSRERPETLRSGAEAEGQAASRPTLVAHRHSINSVERPPTLGSGVEAERQVAPRLTLVATRHALNSSERPASFGSGAEADSQAVPRPTLIATRHSRASDERPTNSQAAPRPTLVATRHLINSVERPTNGSGAETDSQATSRPPFGAIQHSINSVERPTALGSGAESDSRAFPRPTLVTPSIDCFERPTTLRSGAEADSQAAAPAAPSSTTRMTEGSVRRISVSRYSNGTPPVSPTSRNEAVQLGAAFGL